MRWSSKRKASASSSTPSAYAATSRCLSWDDHMPNPRAVGCGWGYSLLPGTHQTVESLKAYTESQPRDSERQSPRIGPSPNESQKNRTRTSRRYPTGQVARKRRDMSQETGRTSARRPAGELRETRRTEALGRASVRASPGRDG